MLSTLKNICQQYKQCSNAIAAPTSKTLQKYELPRPTASAVYVCIKKVSIIVSRNCNKSYQIKKHPILKPHLTAMNQKGVIYPKGT